MHGGKSLPEARYIFGNVLFFKNHGRHVVRQLGEVGFLHAEAGHLLDTGSQSAAGGEALIIGQRLEVDDDVVFLQPFRHLHTAGIADAQDNLMRLGIANGRVSLHPKSPLLQGVGKSFSIGQHLTLVVVPVGIHLVGGHEQPEQGAEVMVADTSRERAP